MKPFIIALTLYLFVNISSCSTNDAPIVEPPNGETAEDSNTPTMNEQIRIIIGNASFTATLEDNATTKAFKPVMKSFITCRQPCLRVLLRPEQSSPAT